MPLLTGKRESRRVVTSSSNRARELTGTSRLRLRVIWWKSLYLALRVAVRPPDG